MDKQEKTQFATIKLYFNLNLHATPHNNKVNKTSNNNK